MRWLRDSVYILGIYNSFPTTPTLHMRQLVHRPMTTYCTGEYRSVVSNVWGVQNLPTLEPTDNHRQPWLAAVVTSIFVSAGGLSLPYLAMPIASADPDNRDNQGLALTNMVIHGVWSS